MNEKLRSHTNWNENDYRYLTAKGFDDDAILAIWERDAAMGKPACSQKYLLDSLERASADIASLMDWLQQEIQKRRDSVSWGTVGTLEHLRQNLIESLESVSGISEAEIKRSLDELHM